MYATDATITPTGPTWLMLRSLRAFTQVAVNSQDWLMGALACGARMGVDVGKADNVVDPDGHQGTHCNRKAPNSQSLYGSQANEAVDNRRCTYMTNM